MSHSADTFVEVSIVPPSASNQEMSSTSSADSPWRMDGYLRKRTSTKYDTMFPIWRDEPINFNITKPSSEANTFKNMRAYLKDTTVFLVLKDAKKDEDRSDSVIGVGEISLKNIINQTRHSFWIKLKQPATGIDTFSLHICIITDVCMSRYRKICHCAT
jgi:hypothetical protein